MKKILSLVFILSLFVLTSCDDSNTLYVGTSPDYAPFEFIDNSKKGDAKYVGADIELARYIAKELGMKLVIKPSDFDTVLGSAQTGTVDLAISGITDNGDRRNNYEFSDGYYDMGDGRQLILIHKDNKDKYKTLADLNKPNVKISAQTGSVQNTILEEQIPNCDIQLRAEISLAVSELAMKKIDAVVIAEVPGLSVLKSYEDLQFIADFELDQEPSPCFILTKKGNKELIEKINTIIKKVKEEGLYQKWFDEAVLLYNSIDEE